MKREVRAILAAKNYHDVDFVNCHPVILEQVLNRHFIPCPMLSKYVAKRESCIQDVMSTCSVSRDAAKTLFLRLIFLGSIEAWISEELGDNNAATRPPPQYVFDLRDELVSNAERLVMDGSVLMTYAQIKARWELRSLKIIVFGDYMREEREKHIIYNRSKLIDAYEHLKYSEFVTSSSPSSSTQQPNVKTLKLQKHSFIKSWIADEDIRTKKYIDIVLPGLNETLDNASILC